MCFGGAKAESTIYVTFCERWGKKKRRRKLFILRVVGVIWRDHFSCFQTSFSHYSDWGANKNKTENAPPITAVHNQFRNTWNFTAYFPPLLSLRFRTQCTERFEYQFWCICCSFAFCALEIFALIRLCVAALSKQPEWHLQQLQKYLWFQS